MMYSTIVMCTIVLVASAYKPLPHIPPGESNTAAGPIEFKPGFCPFLHLYCSPIRALGTPVTCFYDGNCGAADKCCIMCLGKRFCMAPEDRSPHPPHPVPYH
ncbi:uncharacterized protein LOC143031083 [Oratosquilla oratoria]|uniref:uncharacterized protein LOC143031083 n=1 Tax=Oratosquilla oratoria TaxID=337810 RepID=UPI003F771112